MLFWEGLKKNFAHFYEDDMLEAEKILATINPEDIVKNLDEKYQKLLTDKEEAEKMLAEYKKDPEGVIKKYNANGLHFIQINNSKNEIVLNKKVML